MRKALIVLSLLLFPTLAMAQVPVVDAGPSRPSISATRPRCTARPRVIPLHGSGNESRLRSGSGPSLLTRTCRSYVFYRHGGRLRHHGQGHELLRVERPGWGHSYGHRKSPPIAVASAIRPLSGPAPLTVTFDGTGSSDPEGGDLLYDWDFGDGFYGTGATTTHVFDRPGTYPVILFVADDHGLGDFVFVEITVCGDNINCPPVADAGEDQAVYLDEAVQLSGAASDHDGDEIVSWAWSIESAPEGSSASFNDTGIPDPVFSPDLLGASLLSLVVSDGEDTSESDTLTITVEEPPAGWGGASVVGMQSASPAKGLSYLIALLIPIGAVLLWKGLRKRE